MNDKQLPRPEIISKIDGFLDMLSYDELQFFNRRVYEKLKDRRAEEAQRSLVNFRIGDKVSFKHVGGTIVGIIVRLNQRTAGIFTEDGHNWRVHPSLLRKIILQKWAVFWGFLIICWLWYCDDMKNNDNQVYQLKIT